MHEKFKLNDANEKNSKLCEENSELCKIIECRKTKIQLSLSCLRENFLS